MRKMLAGTIGLAALGAAAFATPALAQWEHHHHYRHHHHYYPHHYYHHGYYYRPGVVIAPYYHRCWRAWRTVRVGYHWERRLVRICR
jgi:hypothetical protein